MFRKSYFLLAALFATQLGYAACTAEADIKPNCCVGPSLCHTGPMIEKDSCDCDYGMWNIEIGFLLEQARLTGTQLAVSVVPGSGYDSGEFLVVRPSFDLDWGVTASLGWFVGDDGWYFGARFDWLESTASKSREAAAGAAIVPVNIVGGFILLRGDSFSSRLKINYYMLDVMLSRGAYLSGCFAIEPHAGIKTAWFYYRGHATFPGTDATDVGNVTRRIHTDSWGVGPEVGVDLDFNFATGFSFYAESGLALLFGQSKPKDRGTLVFTNGDTGDFQAKESRDVAVPSARLALGFKFSSCFCENRHYVYLKVAFDSVFYWNQFDHINDQFSLTDPGLGGELPVQVLASDNNTYSLMGLKLLVGWVF